ncbi:MAG TPA: dockerin type I domain-containing protein [Planctomycetota bacterium]
MTDEPDPKLPPALQRDLRRMFGPQVRIPAAVDAQLAAAARRRRLRPVWLRPVLVAAAIVLLALPLVFTWLRQSATTTAIAREDFDRNGRVDVLDAYRLALALQRGQSVPATFDLDGDGRVDAHDADRIAARAVRIGG